MCKKHSYDFVYKAFKDEGCELLETEYVNVDTKMQYRCSCGNESSIKFNNFKSGNRCAKCGGTEKLTFEEVFKYFKDEGCELLETEYINAHTKMRYKCKCGNESSIIFNNFKNLNRRCKECQIKDTSGENHYRFKTDRSRLCRSTYLSFDNNKLHLLSDDPNYINHIRSKKVANASGNRWVKSDYTVDHIQPRIAFIDNDLDLKYDLKIIKEICNLRENLRIIHGKDNRKKAGKYNQDEFMAWFNEKINLYNLKGNINANCKNDAIDEPVGCCNNQLHARCG